MEKTIISIFLSFYSTFIKFEEILLNSEMITDTKFQIIRVRNFCCVISGQTGRQQLTGATFMYLRMQLIMTYLKES